MINIIGESIFINKIKEYGFFIALFSLFEAILTGEFLSDILPDKKETDTYTPKNYLFRQSYEDSIKYPKFLGSIPENENEIINYTQLYSKEELDEMLKVWLEQLEKDIRQNKKNEHN